MANIKDVAEQAGVSLSTVSRVLNRPEMVSETLRTRIEDAMQDLDYRPNMVAKSLKTKVTGNVGIILNDMLHFNLNSMADALGSHNLNLILRDSEDNWGLEANHIRQLADKHVDGLLLSPVGIRHAGLVRLQEMNLPTVVLGEEVDGLSFPHVSYDVFAGSYQAANYLLDRGHRRIGFIAGTADNRVRRDLFDGFRIALEKHRVSLQPSLVRTNMPSPNGGEKAMCQILRLHEQPTALFVAHPRMAQGVMATLYTAGLRCPQDMSAIVFGDSEWAKASFPPMTVLEPRSEEFGRCAVESLVDLIEDTLPRERRTVRVPTSLVERHSVAVPAYA
jgi:LacI family transcriptional regulator